MQYARRLHISIPLMGAETVKTATMAATVIRAAIKQWMIDWWQRIKIAACA
jgi:hypothetical protein